MGEAVLLEQIAALEVKGDSSSNDSSDNNSDYESFHSDEVVGGGEEKVKAIEPPQKDWMLPQNL